MSIKPKIVYLILFLIVCSFVSQTIATMNSSNNFWNVYTKGKIRCGYFGGYSGSINSVSPDLIINNMKESGMNSILIKCRWRDEKKFAEDIKNTVKWIRSAHEKGIIVFLEYDLFGNTEIVWLKNLRDRYVFDNGEIVNSSPDPFDPAFWKLHHDRLTMMAKLVEPGLISGLVLDAELYGTPRLSFFPPKPSYGDTIFYNFLKAKGIITENPISPSERGKFIKEKNLVDQYAEFCEESLKKYIVDIREDIEKVCPDIVFGGYGIDHNDPFARGIVKGFSTPEKPFFYFTGITYHVGAAEKYMQQVQKLVSDRGAGEQIVCGIWIDQFSPEAYAAHLYYAAKSSAGYWIYPVDWFRPDGKIRNIPAQEYIKNIKIANEELDKTLENPDYKTTLKITSSPPTKINFSKEDLHTEAWIPVFPRKDTNAVPNFILRYKTFLRFYCNEGEEIEIRLRHLQLGSYQQFGEAIILDPHGTYCQAFRIDMNQSEIIKWKAKMKGAYMLACTVDSNALIIDKISHPIAFMPPFNIHSVKDVDLKIYVPEGNHKVVLNFMLGGREGRRVLLVDKDGNVLAQADVTEFTKERKIEAEINNVPKGGVVYTVQFRTAPGSPVEDFIVEKIAGIPPFYAVEESGLLMLSPQK